MSKFILRQAMRMCLAFAAAVAMTGCNEEDKRTTAMIASSIISDIQQLNQTDYQRPDWKAEETDKGNRCDGKENSVREAVQPSSGTQRQIKTAESRVEEIEVMDWKTILTATVVAAFVSAISSIVVAILNNRRLRKIETDKRKYEWKHYRFTKLYELLERVERLHGFIGSPQDPLKTINDALSRRLELIELYKLARPLIGSNNRKEIDSKIIEEKNAYKPLEEEILTKNSAIKANDWLSVAKYLPDVLSEAINDQLVELSEN
ncbi:hypothetical protein FACS18942_03830 [Planctomycetales bacterium]|nr:hypothetical protein FACS18942_03830 [Planctomycetales bacterium]GHT37478.1 hypothetical protein FACS189427_10470 [Planctomycetales bacterium]